ncbi:PEGA domain-containing protein [Sandaracinus amylolyticus]|uniref:PEGA domain-containing protein n=1 Tax=Sandaracinus amylolyticus TaxID=927083 RepID=UPI001F3CCA70|nr:PEGA domain-containing protein [Sandaracinus amylolyticus]UJR79478.1 Hypothetical protein I5071_15140 [Sandaracinus amylolyticus]
MARALVPAIVLSLVGLSWPALAQVDAPEAPETYESVDPIEAEPIEGSPTQDPRELEADVQLDVGRTLASEGRCEVAIPRLERALDLADSLDARFHLGACLHALGRNAEALEHIERFAAQVDPDVDMERAAIALRILERARTEVGSLALVVEPPGALVMIDGRAVIGRGQRIVRIDAGRHVLRAEYVGHQTIVRSVDIEPGGRALRLVRLEAIASPSAFLELEMDPPDARVIVDGRALRVGARVLELEPGWHRVTVAARGRETRERDVQVGAGERLRLDLSLPERRDDGMLVLAGTTAIVGAIVLGVAIGFAVGSQG